MSDDREQYQIFALDNPAAMIIENQGEYAVSYHAFYSIRIQRKQRTETNIKWRIR